MRRYSVMKTLSARFLIFVIMPLLMTFFSSCTRVVTIKKPEAYPEYVCSGVDRVTFKWAKIRGVDRLRFYAHTANTKEFLRKLNPKKIKQYRTPLVKANWDYIQVIGCQRKLCKDRFWNIDVIDNPKWTSQFFNENFASLRIIGDDPFVDYSEPIPGYVESYYVYQVARGYAFTLLRENFSTKTRVLEVKYDRIESVFGGIGIDGMYIEAVGYNVVPRTWVPKGSTLSISNPFHPANTTWYLYFKEPTRIIVGQQFGKPDPDEKPEWYGVDEDLLPCLILLVKCAD
jgi:hypothetical protein